jgi:hypothetical protein
MKLARSVENFFYKKILRGLLFTSRLGRKSMMGYADSGINFDYIYRNAAIGYTWFGKIVDRFLLNLPAAKATVNRKKEIVNILKREIDKNISLGKKTRIVDLASGPARYIIEAIDGVNKQHVETLCLELDRRSIEFGKRISLDKPILYKKANILKIAGRYKAVSEKVKWTPNLIMVSGFIEYQQDDSLVLDLLKNVYQYLDDKGFFLLVTQMASPNAKLTEKLGTTKNGKGWVLHYRGPDLLSKLMTAGGFKNVKVIPDRWKMYVYCKGEK